MASSAATARALLALDLGTCTGWALQERSGRICSGSQPFRPQRWLTELSFSSASAGQPLIDQVVVEEVRRHAGVDAAHAYGGFLGQLGSFCEHHQIPYQGVPVGTIKRFIAGKGNASKEQVIAADALALLHWAIASGTAASSGGADG